MSFAVLKVNDCDVPELSVLDIGLPPTVAGPVTPLIVQLDWRKIVELTSAPPSSVKATVMLTVLPAAPESNELILRGATPPKKSGVCAFGVSDGKIAKVSGFFPEMVVMLFR